MPIEEREIVLSFNIVRMGQSHGHFEGFPEVATKKGVRNLGNRFWLPSRKSRGKLGKGPGAQGEYGEEGEMQQAQGELSANYDSDRLVLTH